MSHHAQCSGAATFGRTPRHCQYVSFISAAPWEGTERSGLRGSRTALVSSVLLSDDLTFLVRRLLHEVPDLRGEVLQFLQGKPVDGGVVKGVQVPRVGGECHFLCPFQDLKSIWGKSYVIPKNFSAKFS